MERPKKPEFLIKLAACWHVLRGEGVIYNVHFLGLTRVYCRDRKYFVTNCTFDGYYPTTKGANPDFVLNMPEDLNPQMFTKQEASK